MNERSKGTKMEDRRRMNNRENWRKKMGETLEFCGQTKHGADKAGEV